MLRMTPDVARAIAAHAEATYPDECVGLLLGRLADDHKLALAVHPAENRWEGQMQLAAGDDPTSRRDRFYLDPRDYLRAERAAGAQGIDVIGVYHSHPDDVAQPSERDRIGAQGAGGGPHFAFAIQSVRQGVAAELTSWLLLDNGARFVQEQVEEIADNR